MELRFSRRHPYEPPKVVFPPVQGRNLKNPRHPNVDTAGKLWLRDLSHDSWSPIMTVSQIVSMVSSLFSVDPPSLRLNRGKGRAGGSASASSSAAALSPNSRQAADADADADADTAEAPCPMNNVSAETVFKLLSWLPEQDICSAAASCKKLLAATHDNELWATLFLARAPGLPCFEEHLSPDVGPTRVLALGPDRATRKWTWVDARERCVRAPVVPSFLPSFVRFLCQSLTVCAPPLLPFAHVVPIL
jgi:hypothetical protein